MKTMIVKSEAFEDNGLIPVRYSCDGANVNPPLSIEEIPKEAKSLALIMDDPDAPIGTFDHWIVWNIQTVGRIDENSVPGTEGVNSAGKRSYMGPCPPSGSHRYFFKIFALDTKLELPSNAGKKEVEKAMKEHILARGELMARFNRKRA